jgi:hypothetical protein
MRIKPIALLTLSTLMLGAGHLSAETARDCLLTGTVEKSTRAGEEVVNVKFHSMEKYDEDAKCRVRKRDKLEFRLPADPRLKDAPAGSEVEYRYREDSEGGTRTDLLRVGT